MESMTSNPNRFAAWFNMTYQGAHRRITTEDVEDMTTCGLIGRYRYYSTSQDGEIIRGILQYEQIRETRSTQKATEDKLEPPKCKMCGKTLPPQSEVKKGRPRQYCPSCQSSRATERYRRWRKRKRRLGMVSTAGDV